jgi:hypothetical protein
MSVLVRKMSRAAKEKVGQTRFGKCYNSEIGVWGEKQHVNGGRRLHGLQKR